MTEPDPEPGTSQSEDNPRNEGDTEKARAEAEAADASYETNSWKQVEAYLRGDDCRCRLNCFRITTEQERRECFVKLHSLQSKNEQDAQLQSLMSLLPIQRRRPRVLLPDRPSKRREINFSYSIPTLSGNATICKRAFMSIHGVSDDRVRRIGKLLHQGKAPRDMRGLNRPGNAKPMAVVEAVRRHIASFLTKQTSSQNFVFPQKLNLKAMYGMFKREYPDIDISKSYYITRFHKDFSQPRVDGSISLGVSIKQEVDD